MMNLGGMILLYCLIEVEVKTRRDLVTHLSSHIVQLGVLSIQIQMAWF